MSLTDDFMDIVELCTLLQCLGFKVKSLDTRDVSMSQENSMRNVVITCQSSGLHVIMESSEARCSCPGDANKDNSGFWQVSGVTGGKQHNTECGSVLLGNLSKTQREQISKELQNIIMLIKDSKTEKPREGNRSASMLELSTADMRLKIKADTPTRYRSLDTLAMANDDDSTSSFPMPRSFKCQIPKILERQRTYSVSSTPDSLRGWNKTSSPIQEPHASKDVLEKLIYASNCCEETQNHIKYIIRKLSYNKNNSSYQELDVSKIPVIKVLSTPKSNCVSSPNIPALVIDEKDNIKRCEPSTSTIATKEKISCLRRLSPSLMKLKKDKETAAKVDKKPKESKFTSLFKPNKALAQPSTSRSSPNLSASKKKFSHVKSTIPKPS